MLGTGLRRWNWLEDGLIPLLATVMYAAWAYPLFALFLADPGTGARNQSFTFWLCLGLLLAGVVSGRLASRNRMGPVIVVVGGLAAVLVVLLLTIPAGSEPLGVWFAEILNRVGKGRPGEALPIPLMVAGSTVLLWWRGVRIASSDHDETSGSFVVGVIGLAGLLILALIRPPIPAISGSGAAPPSASAAGFAPLVFVLSLPAVLAFAVLARYIGYVGVILSQSALVVGLLFLASVLPYGPSREALIRWILVFLVSGLAALAVLGVLRTLEEQQQRIGVRLHVDRYWLVSMLSVIAGVLTLGLLVGRVLAPDTIVSALGWLRPIWNFFLQVVLLIVFVFAYLLFSLLEPLLAGLQRRPSESGSRPFESPLDLEALRDPERAPIRVPPVVWQVLQWALILAGVALVAYVFYLAVRRQRQGRVVTQDEIPETRQTVLSADLLRSQLQGLLNGLRRPRPKPLFLELGAMGDARRVVRELYQRVLARAAELELPRRRAQTPRSYQESLTKLCPEEKPSVASLTDAYVVARYGVLPPSGQQVEQAQEAYAHIEAALAPPAEQENL